MTRVLPAFVAALLAIAPSVGGALGASADGFSWAARAGELARSGQDALVRERSATGAHAPGRERASSGLFVAVLPVQARVAVTCAQTAKCAARDRIVDARALARRTFTSRRVAPYGADDPDAAA